MSQCDILQTAFSGRWVDDFCIDTIRGYIRCRVHGSVDILLFYIIINMLTLSFLVILLTAQLCTGMVIAPELVLFWYEHG